MSWIASEHVKHFLLFLHIKQCCKKLMHNHTIGKINYSCNNNKLPLIVGITLVPVVIVAAESGGTAVR